MTTSTICAGFRKCGVYPFNLKAIDCGISVASSDKENRQSDKGQQSAEMANAGNHAESQQRSIMNEERSDKQWSAEKIALFQRRFEEGYDLPDTEYLQWLHETHPPDEENTSLLEPNEERSDKQWSAEKIALFQRRFEEGYDLPNAEYLQWLHETHPPDEENTSLLEHFSDVAIATPIAIATESPMEVPETENETLHSTNPQSDTVRLEKEGDTVPLEKEGDIVKKRARCDELDNSDVLDSDGPSCSSTVSTEGNTNMWQCSICYEVYNEEDTEDWVECGCGRWTHESCITDIVIDVSGKELFCPYCSV